MPTETTVAALLSEGRQALAQVETPGLDARLLLQAATNLSHADIIGDEMARICEQNASLFRAYVDRRAGGEPVSRILGLREFYGRDFRVTPAVLDPRPDTETLIDAALVSLADGARMLDLGAGSGAIIITLLAERPLCQGVAVDLSPEALAVVAENAKNLDVLSRLSLVQGSWFEAVDGAFDLIVSNPPYISAGDISGLAREVREHDPHLALVGGEDGLDAYRAIAAGAGAHLAPEGLVMVEIGLGQTTEVTRIFFAEGFSRQSVHRDLAGHDRVLVFSKG